MCRDNILTHIQGFGAGHEKIDRDKEGTHSLSLSWESWAVIAGDDDDDDKSFER
jgi:hypothetical protein